MKKYLIGLVIISALTFFLISNNSNSNESNSFTNAVSPTPLQIADFALGEDEPFLAVNLLTFKDKAEYEDGRETNLTGEEAYTVYANEVIAHLAKIGAETIFAGEVQRLILGDVKAFVLSMRGVMASSMRACGCFWRWTRSARRATRCAVSSHCSSSAIRALPSC